VTRDWWLDHPVIVIGLIVGLTVAGFAAGVGGALLADATGAVGPDNVLAGAAMGLGGVVAGAAAGALAVWRLNVRYSKS
jgi:hypothetical protein